MSPKNRISQYVPYVPYKQRISCTAERLLTAKCVKFTGQYSLEYCTLSSTLTWAKT
jgi:hypothetical protein